MKETEYLKEKNELVDIIHCAFNDWDDYSEECYESHISPQEEVEDFVADAVLHAGYRKQEWISVADALPEDEQTVLTIDTEREMQVCFYETAQKGVFQLFHGLVSVYNITHWMPLPSAPKGE